MIIDKNSGTATERRGAGIFRAFDQSNFDVELKIVLPAKRLDSRDRERTGRSAGSEHDEDFSRRRNRFDDHLAATASEPQQGEGNPAQNSQHDFLFGSSTFLPLSPAQKIKT